jgi:putative addiction module killer protein
MVDVRQTVIFSDWLTNLADMNAKARIVARIRRLELGNPGDTKGVGDKVSEMRVDYGSGYRLYFTRKGRAIVILLCGGDKGSQRRDIKEARKLAKEV